MLKIYLIKEIHACWEIYAYWESEKFPSKRNGINYAHGLMWLRCFFGEVTESALRIKWENADKE